MRHRQKNPKKAVVVPEQDDVELADEDYEFFGDDQLHAQFLSSLDAKQLTSIGKVKNQPRMLTASKKSRYDASVVSSDEDNDLFDKNVNEATINAELSSSDDDDEIHQELLGDIDNNMNQLHDLGDSDLEELSRMDDEDEYVTDSDNHAEALQGTRRERKQALSDDVALIYEERPRINEQNDDDDQPVNTRLPIKLADGTLVMPKLTRADVANEMKPSLSNAHPPAVSGPVNDKTKVNNVKNHVLVEVEEKELTGQAYIVAKSELLASIAQQVLEDPEKHITKLNKLLPLLNDQQPKVQKLAVLTLLSVFKDIIPGYKINPLSGSQMLEKVSSDVRKLRNFEQCLLKCYQQYLQTLEKTLGKVQSKGPVQDTISESHINYLCLTSMTTLLSAHPHFNFRLNLLNVIVSQLMSPFVPLQLLAADSMHELFRVDENGEPTTEAVKLIAKQIKARSYNNVAPGVIRTFLSLRLKNELTLEDLLNSDGSKRNNGQQDQGNQKINKKNRVHISKRQRKVNKREAEVRVEMKEAEAVYTLKERRKHHTATLEHIFLTYIRVLKNAPRSPLVPTVLEGLCRFVHLISVEFFTSLFDVFKGILNDANATPRSQLMCVVTAVEVVSGQGESLNLDLEIFYKCAYRLTAELVVSCSWETPHPVVLMDDDEHIGEITRDVRPIELSNVRQRRVVDKEVESNLELGLRAIDLLFCRRRQPPALRAAAFILRLMSLATSAAPPHAILSVMVVVHAMLTKYPIARSVLYLPSERAATGLYNPIIDDPTLAFPLSGTPWEFQLLQKHWHADVRALATRLVKDFSTVKEDNGRGNSKNDDTETIDISPLSTLGVGIRSWRDVWAQREWRGGSRFKPGIKEPRSSNRQQQASTSTVTKVTPHDKKSTKNASTFNRKRKPHTDDERPRINTKKSKK